MIFKYPKNLLIQLLSVALILTLTACSSTDDIDTSTAEGSFKLAEKYEKDERYEEALAQYNDTKVKFPYSKLASESTLRIAEIHFKRDSFVEAEAIYLNFKDLHPRHAQIARVTFRLGESVYKQLPDTIDRDLSVATRAIFYFDEILNSYSTSEFTAESLKLKNQIIKMLAEKEYYIAQFYFIREKYDSALGRFEHLLSKYPGNGFNSKALYGAMIAAYNTKDKPKANRFFLELEKLHKTTDEYKMAADFAKDKSLGQ